MATPLDHTREDRVLVNRATLEEFYIGIPTGETPAFPSYVPDDLKVNALFMVTGTGGGFAVGLHRYNGTVWVPISADVDLSGYLAINPEGDQRVYGFVGFNKVRSYKGADFSDVDGTEWNIPSGNKIDLNKGTGGDEIWLSAANGGNSFKFGAGITRSNGSKAVFDDTLLFGKTLNYFAVPDASYAPGDPNFYLQLGTITANRTISLPAGVSGQHAVLWNRNTSAFNWNLSGANLYDRYGNLITTLPGIGVYTILSNGVSWVLQSQSSIDTALSIAYAATYSAVAAIATGSGTKLIIVKNDEVNGGNNSDGSYAASIYLYANSTLLFLVRQAQ